MTVEVYQGDILTLVDKVDTIVCSCNPAMVSAGGVCGVIHRAAGKELTAYISARYSLGLHTCEVALTPGFGIKDIDIIHTVAPVGGHYGPGMLRELLTLTYLNVFGLAAHKELKRIAVPALGTGIYHIPLDIGAWSLFDAAAIFPDLDIILTVLGGEHYRVFSDRLHPLVANS